MINFREKFVEIKMLYKAWLKRQITLFGSVAVLKSLILSKIIHLWILLPNPLEHVIIICRNIVLQFVWNKTKEMKYVEKIDSKYYTWWYWTADQ